MVVMAEYNNLFAAMRPSANRLHAHPLDERCDGDSAAQSPPTSLCIKDELVEGEHLCVVGEQEEEVLQCLTLNKHGRESAVSYRNRAEADSSRAGMNHHPLMCRWPSVYITNALDAVKTSSHLCPRLSQPARTPSQNRSTRARGGHARGRAKKKDSILSRVGGGVFNTLLSEV